MLRELLRYFAVPLAMGALGLVVTLPSWMHAADEGQARLQPSQFARAGIELAPGALIATLYWTNGDKFFAWGITAAMSLVGLFVSEQMRVTRMAAART